MFSIEQYICNFGSKQINIKSQVESLNGLTISNILLVQLLFFLVISVGCHPPISCRHFSLHEVITFIFYFILLEINNVMKTYIYNYNSS